MKSRGGCSWIWIPKLMIWYGACGLMPCDFLVLCSVFKILPWNFDQKHGLLEQNHVISLPRIHPQTHEKWVEPLKSGSLHSWVPAAAFSKQALQSSWWCLVIWCYKYQLFSGELCQQGTAPGEGWEGRGTRDQAEQPVARVAPGCLRKLMAWGVVQRFQSREK